jgi:adenine phosphoribosyltransferase
MNVLDHIRTVPDFPKKGIMFKDITSLLENGPVFGELMKHLATRYSGRGLTHIAGIESRGFIFGAALAQMLEAGFVPIRKLGKLPGKTLKRSYALEYGEATLEIHANAFPPDSRVLIVDDVLATGGTLEAAVGLVTDCGARVESAWVLLELGFLNGRAKLPDVKIRSEAVIDSE